MFEFFSRCHGSNWTPHSNRTAHLLHLNPVERVIYLHNNSTDSVVVVLFSSREPERGPITDTPSHHQHTVFIERHLFSL